MEDLDLCGCTLGEGQFVVLERVGEGGFATAYRAEQLPLRRDVVIKILQPRRRDAAELRRFKREAELAAWLDHPYAAHIYAFGVDDKHGLPWIAMELVQGITLKRWLETHGPMPLEQFVPFFDCIAQVSRPPTISGSSIATSSHRT